MHSLPQAGDGDTRATSYKGCYALVCATGVRHRWVKTIMRSAEEGVLVGFQVRGQAAMMPCGGGREGGGGIMKTARENAGCEDKKCTRKSNR